jgi:hypothetical protein
MIKYQDKYFKYKKKYLDLKGGETIKNELSKLFKVDQQKINELDIEIKSIKKQMEQSKNAMKENETELQSKTTQLNQLNANLQHQLLTDDIKQITRDLHNKEIEKENINNNKTGVCVTDASKSDEKTFNECLKEFNTLCMNEPYKYHTFKFKGYTIYRNGVADEGKGRDNEWRVTIDDKPNKTPDDIYINSYKDFYYIIKEKYNDTQLVPPNKPGLFDRILNFFK